MKTILFVDDEQINLMLFKQAFKKNYNVLVAKSGEEGIDVLRAENTIEAVVSDMKMPGINGIEFLTRAKQLRPSIHCFILTGYDITDEIQDALNSKLILAYFQKPLDIPKLKQTLKESLE